MTSLTFDLKGNSAEALARAAGLLCELFKEIGFCDVPDLEVLGTLSRLVDHEIFYVVADERNENSIYTARPNGSVIRLLAPEDSTELQQKVFSDIAKCETKYIVRVSPLSEIAIRSEDEFNLRRLIAAAIRPRTISPLRNTAAIYLHFPRPVNTDVIRNFGYRCKNYADRNGMPLIRSEEFVDVCDYSTSPFARKAFRQMLRTGATIILCHNNDILLDWKVTEVLQLLNITARLAIWEL